MKFLISTILITYCIIGYAQSSVDNQIFSNTHGLTRENMLFFEVEGYNGFSEPNDNLFFDERGTRKAKKKYRIPQVTPGSVDSALKVEHKYFITEDVVAEGLVQKNVYYFVPTESKRLKVIVFSGMLERDADVERLIVKSIMENALPGYVITEPKTDSVDFAGRKIYLGGVCRWMGPHNIQCPDYGQMNWSTFRSIEEARKCTDRMIRVTESKKVGEVQEKDSVNVIFEGIKVKALKIKYKIKIPRLIMGGSNILIIYFVAAEVRGKSISCMMSQYTDDINAGKLAPLLREVMELME